MITNFETITHELTAQELLLITPIANAFKKYTKSNPIKAPDIIAKFNNSQMFHVKLTEPRLRKIVNYIRTKSIIPLIATSNGYYVTYDSDEIISQIESLKERARSINQCAEGLKNFIK